MSSTSALKRQAEAGSSHLKALFIFKGHFAPNGDKNAILALDVVENVLTVFLTHDSGVFGVHLVVRGEDKLSALAPDRQRRRAKVERDQRLQHPAHAEGREGGSAIVRVRAAG